MAAQIRAGRLFESGGSATSGATLSPLAGL